MNLRSIVNRILGREEPRKLRNKPGGMAWITATVDEGDGVHVLIGRAVKTVALQENGLWTIDPPQRYVVTHLSRNVHNGELAHPGDRARVDAIADESLEPWRDIGDDEKDESTAWLPAAPRATPAEILRLPVREMSLPVTDPVDPRLEDAIADLCNPPSVHLAVSTLDAPSAASKHALRLVVGTAPTELGRPL